MNDHWILIVVLFYAVKGHITRHPRDVTCRNQQTCSDLVSRVLLSVPLIDGHNDLAYNLNTRVQNQLNGIDFYQNLTSDPVLGTEACPKCQTDIPRLKAGKVGAQFWAAYSNCESQYKDTVSRTLQQIDVIRRFINKYHNEFQFVTSAQGIEDAFAIHKIGSLIGVESGHSIDSSLAVLRLYYELGVRYMTLTHICNTPWASASPMDKENKTHTTGLSEFGKTIVREMNRLGMMIDLSHVSKATQLDVLHLTRAPIIYSHSSAYTLCGHHRNVHDDVLQLVRSNNGIIMVAFVNNFLTCSPEASIQNAISHINHIRRVAGIDHVGLGSDFSGAYPMPTGLEDVSKFPDLLELLAADATEPWTEADLRKLVGLNFLRVFRQVEQVRDEIHTEGVTPYEDFIPVEDLNSNTECVSSY